MTRTRRGTTLAATLALLACVSAAPLRAASGDWTPLQSTRPAYAATWPITVTVATPTERSAVGRWNGYVSPVGLQVFTIAAGGRVRFAAGDRDYASWTDAGGCSVVYRSNYVDVLTHELGHCLGFPDAACPGSYTGVMQPCGALELRPGDARSLWHAGYLTYRQCGQVAAQWC
jgi:hypothetical protein